MFGYHDLLLSYLCIQIQEIRLFLMSNSNRENALFMIQGLGQVRSSALETR